MEVQTPDTLAPPSLLSAAPLPAKRTTTILVVDDAETNRSYVAKLLQDRKICDECLFAEDGLAAYKILREATVDLVLCDLNMPRCDGLKFLRLKSADPSLQNIPVILVTSAEEVSAKVTALTTGASDYVVKPFEPNELVARIGVHLSVQRLQADLMRANHELTRLAHVDSLTELWNRRSFMNKLDEEFSRSRRYDRPFSFALLDIDHFKRLNDTYGHQAGDAALIKVADVLRETLRCHDSIGRYGGEEFAMLLPETPSDKGLLAVERVRSALASCEILFGEARVRLTGSIGVASFPHQLTNKPSDIVSLADAALYDAKRSGRNRVVAAL